MKKAKKFISLLVAKLSEEGLNESEWDKAFEQGVHNLPDGDLKTTLENGLSKYLSHFKKKLSEVQPGQPIASREAIQGKVVYDDHTEEQCVYNLYLQNGHTLNEDTLCELQPHERRSLYMNYLAKRFDDEDEGSLFKYVSKAGEEKLPDDSQGAKESFSWLDDFQTLCLVTLKKCDMSSAKTLQKLMNICLRKLGTSVAECMSGKLHYRGKLLSSDILNLLLSFHFKSRDLNQLFDKPSYADLMASLLSLYVDLNLVLNRNTEDLSELGEHLTFVVHYLLQTSPVHYLDVILQLEAVDNENKQFILPLFRKILLRPPANVTGVSYTKYMVAVRFAMRIDRSNVQEIQQVAHSVPAPPDYMDWLRNLNSDVVDCLPDTKHFKGIHISRFLLNPDEADEDLLEKLLDMMTDRPSTSDEEDSSSQAQEKSPREARENNNPNTELTFFVDTTADKKTAEEIQKDLKMHKVDEKSSNQEEVDIEITESDINNMIQNMDSGSEEETVLSNDKEGEENDGLFATKEMEEASHTDQNVITDSNSDSELKEQDNPRPFLFLPDLSKHVIEAGHSEDNSPEIEIQAILKTSPGKKINLTPSPKKRRLRSQSSVKSNKQKGDQVKDGAKAPLSVSKDPKDVHVYDFASDADASPIKLRKTVTNRARMFSDRVNEKPSLSYEHGSEKVATIRKLRTRAISECSTTSTTADDAVHPVESVVMLDHGTDLSKTNPKIAKTPSGKKLKKTEVSKHLQENIDKTYAEPPREKTLDVNKEQKTTISRASRRKSARYSLRSSHADDTE